MPHKLLLADDSVTIQKVIELTFADEDVDVIAVGDGEQAIHQLKLNRPDIVLADVGMPQRDGYEVASFIKKSPELAHIPVLLLTGAFEPVDEVRAREVGCDGVLVKPFEPQLVIARVKDLISGRRPAFEAAPASPAPAPAPVPADEYFDRLGTLADELATWNPDLSEPVKPVSPAVEPDLRQPASAAVEAAVIPATTPQPPSPHVGSSTRQVPTLAQAFAALLAAERGEKGPDLPLPATVIDDQTIDLIAQRVAERMGGRDLRTTVLEVAERLVTEEIARIKSHAQ